MRLQLLKMCTVVFMLLFAFGCGGGGGGSDSGGGGGTTGGTTGTGGTPLGPPAAMALSSSLTATTPTTNIPLLSRGGQTTIRATVTDNSGLKVADGTVVVFSATAGSITATAATANGVATATYVAGTARGGVTITATAQGVIDSIDIEVAANAGPPATVVLSSSLPSGSLLSQGGEATISATVTDANGFEVDNGTIVSFFATSGSITAAASTTNGVATATFRAENSGGFVTISATSGVVTANNIAVQVSSGPASSVVFVSANPLSIGVKTSGQPESTTLTFKVLDSGGNTVDDGTFVDIRIAAPLGGGETISPSRASTLSGLVTTTLQSGAVAGVVSVVASITPTVGTEISTTARVIILAGLPVSNRFGLAATRLNLPGYTQFGQTSTITAYVADRYSNPVPAGTPIYFASEAGAMALTQAYTNDKGQASADHITQLPLPNTTSVVTGRIGVSKILAWTPGQEAFVDSNGNGRYDLGEPFDDFGEPYIDANDNGQFNATGNVATDERYVDINRNGQYDGPNGVWDGNTFVWNTIDALWSYASPLNIFLTVTPGSTCPNFIIPDGGSCECIVSVVDRNNNPILGGSTLNLPKIQSSDQNFTVTTDTKTIPDATGAGDDVTRFKFILSNNSGVKTYSIPTEVTLNVPALGGTAAFSKNVPFTVTLQ